MGLVPRAIKSALLPLEKWVLQKEYNVAETKKLLEEKLKNIPPESIESPEPYIAVPTMQYISYCMDNAELRDMYANLLANSMNKVVKNGVHPGFVEIIKQLSPDEAKILAYMSNNERIPTISVKANKYTGGFADLINSFTNIAEYCNCENPTDYEKYIDNLVRLGLLLRSNNEWIADDSLYEPLNAHPFITGLQLQILSNPEINKEVKNIELAKGYIKLTSFGKSFCFVCLNVQNQAQIEIKKVEM